jgi:peroxiredoxin
MSGHTYSKLHRYPEAAWQQEASVRTDNAQLIRDRILPDQIHNYAHNSEWMVANFNYIGRANRGIELAMNMIEMPRHPELNTLNLQTNGIPYERRNGTSGQGRRRLLETLLRYELWERAVDLSGTTYLDPTDLAEEQGRRARLLAIAHYELGQPALAQEHVEGLQSAIQTLRKERAAAVEAAEAEAREKGQSTDDQQKAMSNALQRYQRPLSGLEEMQEELTVLRRLHTGETEGLKEALEKLKGVSKDRMARLWWEAKDTEKALELAAEAVKQGTNQVHLLANHADLLWRAEKTEEAQNVFQEVRARSGWIELDLPIFQRLQPIAASLDLPSDWRVPAEYPEDFGERPNIETLGLFRWKPPTAPDWELPQADGTLLSLDQFRGRPVLLVFYLGHSCEHCLQQLNALAPAEKTFKAMGIQMVAVSADSMDALVRTQEQAREGEGFPFPLVADPARRVFREFKAYDGFEDVPLHGVFLLDPDGRIRWQDVGYEPFEDVHFLVEESRRQLELYRDQTQLARTRTISPPEARVLKPVPES